MFANVKNVGKDLIKDKMIQDQKDLTQKDKLVENPDVWNQKANTDVLELSAYVLAYVFYNSKSSISHLEKKKLISFLKDQPLNYDESKVNRILPLLLAINSAKSVYNYMKNNQLDIGSLRLAYNQFGDSYTKSRKYKPDFDLLLKKIEKLFSI